MLHRISLALTALALFAVTVPSRAADEFEFDKLHTQIRFSVTHLGFSHPQGRFLDFDGTLHFDAEHMDQASVDFSVATKSVDMGNAKWSAHVAGKQFFNAAQFPEMKFRSHSVEVTGPKDGIVHGELTLLGVTHPLDLNFHLNKAGPHPFNKKYAVGFSATASLQRSAFGMTAFVPMVSDAVQIHIEVEATRKD